MEFVGVEEQGLRERPHCLFRVRASKSYIVEEFAKKEYRSYILIDFNKAGNRSKIFSTTI